MQQDIEQILNNLRVRFRPEIIKQKTTYYLSLGEDLHEKWTVTLTPTDCDVVSGKVGDADCILKMPADLFAQLIAGTYKPGPMDFFSGKIKTNDLGRLRQLQLAFGI
jgi:hypothetical protein